MRRLTIILVAIAATLSALPQLTAQTRSTGTGFKVVAHPDRAGDLSRKDVSNLFLKKVRSWPDGTPAEPIDLLPRSATREGFSRGVHRRDVASILRFWQRRVFSGTATPPPQARNDEEVLAFVRERSGGIGYVDAGADTRGVAVLTIADLEEP